MSDCQVIFYGELQPGQEGAVVRQKVAALFKASDKQIAAMFSGKRVVLKSGLPHQKAEQYRAALAKAGALAHIEPATAQPEAQEKAPRPQASPKPAQPAPSPAKKAAAPTGAAVQRPVSAPQPVATQKPAPVQAGVGQEGDDVGQAVARQVDATKIGQLQSATLAPTGSTLGEAREQPELDLDLSHMSLSDVGANLQDSYDETPSKEIDISHLSLDQ